MNDEKFKKGIKRSFILFFLGLIFITIIVFYISISPNPKKTIYDEFSNSEVVTTEVSKVFLETKGINKEEFEKYLSVGAILTREDLPKDISKEERDNYKYMLLANSFITDVKGEELALDEINNISYVESNKVNEILKELNGKFIKNNLNVTGYYEYIEDELGNKKYNIQNKEDFVSYLVEFSEAEFLSDNIEVRFKNVFGTNEEITKLMNNEKVSLKTYEYKAIVKENSAFNYSKYYISSIELIDSEVVEYNK